MYKARNIFLMFFMLCHVAYSANFSVYFSSPKLIGVAFEILSGLSHLNQLGIVHRNLTPRNILLDPGVRMIQSQILVIVIMLEKMFENH